MKKILRNKGFTLIEILVVIGIIAILATIVLIAINPARQFKQARNTERTSNVETILNAIGQNIADNKGVIPAVITTTVANIASNVADGGLCAAIVPKYIPALPFDPNATVVDCTAAAYDTLYTAVKDANGRVTVAAAGEDPDSAGTIVISATR